LGLNLHNLASSQMAVICVIDVERPRTAATGSPSRRISPTASATWRAAISLGLASLVVDHLTFLNQEAEILCDYPFTRGASAADSSAIDEVPARAIAGNVVFVIPRHSSELYEPGIDMVSIASSLDGRLVIDVPDGFSIAPVSGDLRYEMTGEVADMLKLSHSVFAGAAEEGRTLTFCPISTVRLEGSGSDFFATEEIRVLLPASQA
jgi:hypothetical protein